VVYGFWVLNDRRWGSHIEKRKRGGHPQGDLALKQWVEGREKRECKSR